MYGVEDSNNTAIHKQNGGVELIFGGFVIQFSPKTDKWRYLHPANTGLLCDQSREAQPRRRRRQNEKQARGFDFFPVCATINVRLMCLGEARGRQARGNRRGKTLR